MSVSSRRDPRRAASPTVVAALHAFMALVAALLLTATSVGTTAAQETAAEETAAPELTWAPLVSLPPVAAPPILSPYELADGYSLGSPGAPVAVEIWEDFQCPYCQRFTFQVEPVLVERYIRTGKARLTFRHLAFLGQESHWAAVASSLAADQDRFWQFHDHLFGNLLGENRGSYDLERLLAMGEASGLDMERFREGLSLDRARQRFAEIDAASRADAAVLGIGSTPTVTVNGVPLQSPDLETVSAAIEAALAAAAPASSPDAAAQATPAAFAEPSPPAG